MPAAYRTTPEPSSALPGGIPFIVGNEAAERFSFYGMKAILTIFMTQFLLTADGQPDYLDEAVAKSYVHQFVSCVFLFGVVGAVISDAVLGKYRTIIAGSLIYCLGHVAMALAEPIPGLELGSPRIWMYVGLGLIAIGSGGIKPCVSAHVGDQFGRQNQHLLSRVFSWFYLSINLGAFASTLLTPVLLRRYGPQVAFGIPAVLMFLATWLFWLGRHRFIHVPATGWPAVRKALRTHGLRLVRNLGLIYLFVSAFWALFDQTASAWVLQAAHMDRQAFGIEWLPDQIQAVNPILILIYVPLFSYVIYPLVGRFFEPTPLRRMTVGMFVTAGSFAISAWIEMQITAGQTPNIVWQLLAYAVLTAGEVMVSITCLEFSYTQAPKQMKSLIMAFYFLTVFLGNQFTAQVNRYIQNDDGSTKLAGADYYWFFTWVMLGAAAAFVVVAVTYRGQTFIPDDDRQA